MKARGIGLLVIGRASKRKWHDGWYDNDHRWHDGYWYDDNDDNDDDDD
jgi:hypothetical protein